MLTSCIDCKTASDSVLTPRSKPGQELPSETTDCGGEEGGKLEVLDKVGGFAETASVSVSSSLDMTSLSTATVFVVTGINGAGKEIFDCAGAF